MTSVTYERFARKAVEYHVSSANRPDNQWFGGTRIMTLIGILSAISLALWLVVFSRRKAQQQRFGSVTFAAACVIGVAVSVALMNVTRQPTPTLKLHGIPFPLAGSEIVNGQWISGLVSPYGIFAMLGNVSVGLCICLLPLRIVHSILRNRDENLIAEPTAGDNAG